MNTANKSAARRLSIFLLPIMLLAGCAVVAPEPVAESVPHRSYPGAAKSERTPVDSGKAPAQASPTQRSGTAPPIIERRVPTQQPVIASPQIRPAPVPVPAAMLPAAPLPVHLCDAGGCFGSDGQRYGGGVGNIYLDSKGKPCQRIGGLMQCN